MNQSGRYMLTGGGFELSQMVLEPDIEQCTNEDASSEGGGL